MLLVKIYIVFYTLISLHLFWVTVRINFYIVKLNKNKITHQRYHLQTMFAL